MRIGRSRGWRTTVLSPRLRSALGGVLVGATLSLLLVAMPLWFLGSGGADRPVDTGAPPLAALATLPSDPGVFDISSILVGDWVGELCPDQGEPVAVHFEFVHDEDDSVLYSLSLGGELHSTGILSSGACDVAGEDIAFHAFLAILSDCDEACGVDRLYEGHFDEGVLVGSYHDSVNSDTCLSCVGGGTWWLEPEA